MELNELRSKLRPVEEKDSGNLLTVSYSKLDVFEKCERRYKKQYCENKWPTSQTISLDLGNILHKAMEMKARYKINNEEVDYEKIEKALMDGSDEVTEKNSSHIYGVNEIKKIYFEDWMNSLEDKDNKSYPEKIEIFKSDVLRTRMEDSEWKTIGAEIPFEFVYDNKCIVHGYIDRLDENVDSGILKVVDYKSSKKKFSETDIKTPLQMIIYDMGCLYLYDKLPEWHEYDFILLDQKQTTADSVCSKGYLTRGLKKIDRLINEINEDKELNIYPPSPTPLCYWCPYVPKFQSPKADDKWQGDCQYFCQWTPENKVFSVNRGYDPEKEDEAPRKLIF